MNYARTALLLAAMTALFLGIGFLLGGEAGMLLALAFAVATNAFAYWNADKLVLRMHGAREVDRRSAPEFVGMVEQLARRARLPMPKVYLIETDQPNAFATGRNPDNAAVAATTGLLARLDRSEVEAVMAHELAHVNNRDTLIMTITATIAGAISMLANFALFFGGSRNNPLGLIGTIALMILAPIAAMLVQMAISRTREYAADRVGAQICGNPLALASALAKLEAGARRVVNERAEQNPASAHLFIVNPLNGQSLDNLFSTHPNTANRIARLEQMAGRGLSGRGTMAAGRQPQPARAPTRHPGGRRGPWG